MTRKPARKAKSAGEWSVADGRQTLGTILYRPRGRSYVALNRRGKAFGAFGTLQAAMAAFDAAKAEA